MIPEKSREIFQTALKKGGEVLLDHLGRTTQATIKESISSVVTEADLASEQAILKVFDEAPEAFNVITEESGYINNNSEYTWVVDPLDGTSNFAAGLPWFGVIIALFYKETPVLGGMYLPVDQQLYLAEAGGSATRNGEPLHVTPSTDLSEHLVAYSFDFSEDRAKTSSELEIMASLSREVRNIRSTNSLIDFCYVADGRLGAALNQTTKIWDIAVPWLLIRNAGGTVSDIKGREIKFDLSAQAVNLNYTIIASGAQLHKPLLKILHYESA
ncbi:MAG: inositol monophosphatase [Bacteroidales bacterium]|nr:inositol monophosphatase [Bacteroidales bacterium]